MAEDKKGFLLYADYIEVFEHLSIEQRGEVIWWILQYVNDLDPEPLNGLLMAVIANIRAQLKRDLKKYEAKIGKNSESGRIGNLKRWHFDLYEEYKKGNHTLTEAEDIAKGRKVSPRDDSPSPPIAKIADTDNVSDSDTDNVSDSDTSSKKKKKEIIIPSLQEFLLHIESKYKDLKKDFEPYRFAATNKYETWKADGWKDGYKKPIKNWKLKANSAIQYFKPIYNANTQNTTKTRDQRNDDVGKQHDEQILAELRADGIIPEKGPDANGSGGESFTTFEDVT